MLVLPYLLAMSSSTGGAKAVAPSVITSGDSTELQTFDVRAHTNAIRIVPKFQRADQFIHIKEVRCLGRPLWQARNGRHEMAGARHCPSPGLHV